MHDLNVVEDIETFKNLIFIEFLSHSYISAFSILFLGSSSSTSCS
jgi:hypothetical protein